MINSVFQDLAGKHVFITGGGSGIGAALTSGFLAQGAQVSFVQRSDATDFIAEMVELHGKEPICITCDLSNINALQQAMQQAQRIHGDIEVLINNAGNDQRHSLADMDVEAWEANHAVQSTSLFFYRSICCAFHGKKWWRLDYQLFVRELSDG